MRDKQVLQKVTIQQTPQYEEKGNEYIHEPFLFVQSTGLQVIEDSTEQVSVTLVLGPGVRFSKVLVTFRSRSYILKSKSIVRWRSFWSAYQPDLFYQLRMLLLSFNNQQSLSLKCKHRAHKIAFPARKVIGTFEKRAPE